ncbi:Ribonuclease E, partial [hydrothermal vent metagenome]
AAEKAKAEESLADQSSAEANDDDAENKEASSEPEETSSEQSDDNAKSELDSSQTQQNLTDENSGDAEIDTTTDKAVETPPSEGADDNDDENSDDIVEDLGPGQDELLELRRAQARRYKIQEVIKRRQVLLIQVVKEERGNKGAALTTYLSLAGRYSVLMPNTARGGGISRKITSGSDRKRLKQIASELSVPPGMGVILRTAGASRTKADIKRDFEYLSRLWENVRKLTLQSSAPSLVYEEGSLIKRTIRDLYNKDISEVLVSGEPSFNEARDFMQLIMPNHVKNVKLHKEAQHLFSRYGVEAQLDAIFSPQVTLPSGGYIVINPTEALVSIDVNSGRATKEQNIEATALQTNLEAAEEAARQFRLRDLAGLIVIDFIDMNDRRSIRAVEKRLKDALKNDRARIQIGRISHFGLLEMSRQRMRSGVLESSTHACPTCEGTGIIRGVESRALMVLRAVEDHVVRKPGISVEVKAPAEVALYVLNTKRAKLIELEAQNRTTITISSDPAKTASEFSISKGENRIEASPVAKKSISVDSQPAPAVPSEPAAAADSSGDNDNQPKRKRRRRKSSNSQSTNEASAQNTSAQNTSAQNTSVASSENSDSEGNNNVGNNNGETVSVDDDSEDQPRKRRRRGRRGGRRNRRNFNGETDVAQQNSDGQDSDAPSQDATPSELTSQDSTSQDAATPNVAAQIKSGDVATDKSDISSTGDNAPSDAKPASGSSSDQNEVTEPAKEKKPARRRTRKKPASNEEVSSTEEKTQEKLQEKAAKKPRKKAAATKSKSNEKDDVAGQENSAPETKPTKPKKAKRVLPDEGSIISTSNTETNAPAQRKGWWSRG